MEERAAKSAVISRARMEHTAAWLRSVHCRPEGLGHGCVIPRAAESSCRRSSSAAAQGAASGEPKYPLVST